MLNPHYRHESLINRSDSEGSENASLARRKPTAAGSRLLAHFLHHQIGFTVNQQSTFSRIIVFENLVEKRIDAGIHSIRGRLGRQSKIKSCGLALSKQAVGGIQRRFGFSGPHHRFKNVYAGTGTLDCQRFLSVIRSKAENIGKVQFLFDARTIEACGHDRPAGGGGIANLALEQGIVRTDPVGHSRESGQNLGLKVTFDNRKLCTEKSFEFLRKELALLLPSFASQNIISSTKHPRLGTSAVM